MVIKIKWIEWKIEEEKDERHTEALNLRRKEKKWEE